MENPTSKSSVEISENDKSVSTFIHLSTFLKYFFPFGNFVGPLLLWTINKERSFVDEHGKQALNFQLSVLVYTLVIGLVCLPFFIIFASDFIALIDSIEHNVDRLHFSEIKNSVGYAILFFIVVLLLLGLFILELYAVIMASMAATKGKLYKYPICIQFIKTTPATLEQNQSENEHDS